MAWNLNDGVAKDFECLGLIALETLETGIDQCGKTTSEGIRGRVVFALELNEFLALTVVDDVKRQRHQGAHFLKICAIVHQTYDDFVQVVKGVSGVSLEHASFKKTDGLCHALTFERLDQGALKDQGTPSGGIRQRVPMVGEQFHELVPLTGFAHVMADLFKGFLVGRIVFYRFLKHRNRGRTVLEQIAVNMAHADAKLRVTLHVGFVVVEVGVIKIDELAILFVGEKLVAFFDEVHAFVGHDVARRNRQKRRFDGHHEVAQFVKAPFSIKNILNAWHAHPGAAGESDEHTDFVLHHEKVSHETIGADAFLTILDVEIFIKSVRIEHVQGYVDDGFGEDGIDRLIGCHRIAPQPQKELLDTLGVVTEIVCALLAQKRASGHDVFKVIRILESGLIVQVVARRKAEQDEHVSPVKTLSGADFQWHNPT